MSTDNYILIKHQSKHGTKRIELIKKSSFDSSDYVLFDVRKNGLKEYVHRDMYEFYKMIQRHKGIRRDFD